MGAPCSEAGKPCAYLHQHLSGCQCNLDLERNNCRASVALCHREVLHACISRDYKNITITSFFFFFLSIIHLLKSIFLIPASACTDLNPCSFLGGQRMQGWNEKKGETEQNTFLSQSENPSNRTGSHFSFILGKCLEEGGRLCQFCAYNGRRMLNLINLNAVAAAYSLSFVVAWILQPPYTMFQCPWWGLEEDSGAERGIRWRGPSSMPVNSKYHSPVIQ